MSYPSMAEFLYPGDHKGTISELPEGKPSVVVHITQALSLHCPDDEELALLIATLVLAHRKLRSMQLASCDACGASVRVDTLTHRSASSLHDEGDFCEACAGNFIENATEQGAGDDGPDSEGDAAQSGDGADSHDVGRTEPEPAPEPVEAQHGPKCPTCQDTRIHQEPGLHLTLCPDCTTATATEDADRLIGCEACGLRTPSDHLVISEVFGRTGWLCSGCRAGATPGGPLHNAMRLQDLMS